MSNMFYNCSTLKSLPDISKWNTNNATDMSYMFYNCSSLKTLPEISKWNTNNVIDLKYMFYNCSLLLSFPDISKWNSKNEFNIYLKLLDFNSLSSLFKSNANNIKSINHIFAYDFQYKLVF